MAPKMKFLPKQKKNSISASDSSESAGSLDEEKTPQKPTKGALKGRKPSIDTSPMSFAAGEFITSAFNGDMLMNLVNLADIRDRLVKEAPTGFFPDVVSGSVDMSMAIAETMLKFTDSLDKDALSSQEVFSMRVHEFILAVMDAVYGPNCVRITLYNPEVDWTISLWQMLHVEDNSPSDRVFSSQIPSQAEAFSQWIDLKSRLMGHCRNPKKELQQAELITSLEDELTQLTDEYTALLDKMMSNSNTNEGKKSPSKKQSDGSKSNSLERIAACRELVLTKHRLVDPEVRSKRDAILWGGQPHLAASSATNPGKSKRRLSRFGFKSEEEYLSSESSSEGGIPNSPHDVNRPASVEPPVDGDGMRTPPAADNVGCMALFRCCARKPPNKVNNLKK